MSPVKIAPSSAPAASGSDLGGRCRRRALSSLGRAPHVPVSQSVSVESSPGAPEFSQQNEGKREVEISCWFTAVPFILVRGGAALVV